MRAELAVFDLDGTLVDSTGDIAAAMNWVLRELGLVEHPISRYPDFIGEGARNLVEKAVQASGGEESLVDEAFAAFQRRYSTHLVVQTRVFTGVREALVEMARRGLHLAVLSNKPHKMTVEVAARLLAEIPFAPVLGHRSSVARKPDPAGLIEICEHYTVGADRTLMIGDSVIDMATAVRAGAVGVGVTWSEGCHSELVAGGAAAVISQPRELLELPEVRLGRG